MASASSANTSKISGTKVNTVWIDDDWTEWTPKKAEPAEPVYLEFNANPLALVCAMFRNNKQGYEIGETLSGVGNYPRPIDASRAIESQDTDRANTILKYFAKKHTLRRVKGEWISKYMTAVDEIVDNPTRINKDYVGILVSLPRIYEQNLAIERLMKGHKSVPSRKNDLDYPPMNEQLEFVERMNYKSGRINEIHYYWRTPKNYLVRVVVKAGEYGAAAWDTFARHGKIHLDTEMTFTYSIKGYDFNVVQPSPSHMKINIA